MVTRFKLSFTSMASMTIIRNNGMTSRLSLKNIRTRSQVPPL